MTYKIQSLISAQQIGENSATQKHPLGSIVRAQSQTWGEGEFIYLKGVASTVVGSIVNYDASHQTALHSSALNVPRPVAVAMSACVADQFGWYQISGLATVRKANSVSFAAAAALGGTSGLAVAAATGLRLNGAVVATVASAMSTRVTVLVMTNRPAAV
jgi:hypothetical protein